MFKGILILAIVGAGAALASAEGGELDEQIAALNLNLAGKDVKDLDGTYEAAIAFAGNQPSFERIQETLEYLYKIARKPEEPLVCTYDVQLKLEQRHENTLRQLTLGNEGPVSKLTKGLLTAHLAACQSKVKAGLAYAANDTIVYSENIDAENYLAYVASKLDECKSFKENKHDELWPFDCLNSMDKDEQKFAKPTMRWVKDHCNSLDRAQLRFFRTEKKRIFSKYIQRPCENFYWGYYSLVNWQHYISGFIDESENPMLKLDEYRKAAPVKKHCGWIRKSTKLMEEAFKSG